MGRAINMLISVSQSRESRREAASRRAHAVGLPLTNDIVRWGGHGDQDRHRGRDRDRSRDRHLHLREISDQPL